MNEHARLDPEIVAVLRENVHTKVGRRGLPMTHRLAELPHVSIRMRRLLGPLDGLLFDG
jgi:hypothetical protein